MEKIQADRLKYRRALLEALGYDVDKVPKTFNDNDCSICLTSIHDSNKLTLACGHIFHINCMCKWSNLNLKDYKIGTIIPVKGRRISYFKEGDNLFTCPTCRTELTRDPLDVEFKIKKVIAKVHALYKGDACVHYITDPLEPMAYIPRSELTAERKFTPRWCMYIDALNKIWKEGHTDVYAVKRIDGHFFLKSDYKTFTPIDKNGKPIVNNRQLLITKMIDLEELPNILNDV